MTKAKKTDNSKIDCAEAVKRMNDFLDNYLKGKSKTELVQHIAECIHCFERLEFEQMLKSKINAAAQISTEEKTTKARIDKIISKIYPS